MNVQTGYITAHDSVDGNLTYNIYPYVIVITGNFKLGFKYHITGNGIEIGVITSKTYPNAINAAKGLIKRNHLLNWRNRK